MGIGAMEVVVVLVLLLVVGAAFVVLLRALGRNAGRPRDSQILDERYASGEIERDEYERTRRDVEAG